jgi:3-oxoacyl-(acyl-carrier-protein) synthase
MSALATGTPLTSSELVRERPGRSPVISRVLRVPAPDAPATLPKSPRLRRVSPISKYAAAAAVEAVGPQRMALSNDGTLRIGVICALMNGCVNYSNRFFGEVRHDPSVASPILFPETVFNAPSSHLSALFASHAPNDTIVGDGAGFFTALEIATEWLLRGDCDGCVVVAPEEMDWLSAEALAMYSRGYVASEGAAAIYLELDGQGPRLLSVPDPVLLGQGVDRAEALTLLVNASGSYHEDRTLLSDSRSGVARYDRAESEVFANWSGPRMSTRRILGESLGASSGIQCVAAAEALRRGQADQALVVAMGGNEQVAGCLLARE